MASKGQFTGMTGTYLVAAQLSSRHLVASPTSRSAAGADILLTDSECSRAYSIQVKTNGKKAKFWILSRKEPTQTSKHYVYVFVNLCPDSDGDVIADYYIVPSAVVAKIAGYGGDKWPNYSVHKEDIEKYQDKWETFKFSE